MLATYQPQKELKIYRLSDGLEQHRREEGCFEVRYGNGEVKQFTELFRAGIFYIKLQEPAAVYDVTRDELLIEKKIRIEVC